MKRLFPVILSGIVACSSEQASLRQESLQLVSYSKLPTFPAPVFSGEKKIVVYFEVAVDGSILDLRMISSSGSKAWDEQALDSLRRWRFVPAPLPSEEMKRRILDTIIIRFEDPSYLTVEEVRARNSVEADSLYTLLASGSPLDSLASGGAILSRPAYSVDISLFPPHICKALKELAPAHWTKPLRLHEGYVLFRRIDE